LKFLTYTISILTLFQAFVINEDESEALNSDEGTFQFIHKLLSDSLKGKEHRSLISGFSADEVVEALNKLAVNDANKLRIVQFGFLPLYVQLLQPTCTISELTAATKGIWILAFKCREDIVNEPGCLEGIVCCFKSSFPAVNCCLLLGRIACKVHSDVARSVVCPSVCPSVLDRRVSCAKMAEPIEMPFGG